MPADVIDLLSSSPGPNLPPPPHQPSARAPRTSHTRVQNGNGSTGEHGLDRKPEKLAPGPDELWSDGFESIIDLSGPALAQISGNKRRRISTKPPHKDGEDCERTRFIESNSENRRDSLDITELTSSAVVPASIESPAVLPSVEEGNEHDAVSRNVLLQESDPFASSPVWNTYTPDAFKSVRGSNPTRLGQSVSERAGQVLDLIQSSAESIIYDERHHPQKAASALLSDPFASSPLAVEHQSCNDGRSNKVPRGHSPRRREDLEPISSSAPPESCMPSSPPTRTNKFSSAVIEIDSGSSSSSESDSLPEIADIDFSRPVRKERAPFRRTKSETLGSKKSSHPKKGPSKTAEERAKDRQARTAAKELDKAAKRRERDQVKADKARERAREAALTEVNKMRTDKKVSTPEMIVDLPTTMGETLNTQLQAMLKELDVQWDSWTSPVPNVVKWRRKVTSKFNIELGYWEPIPRDIRDEKHALVFMTADELVKLVQEQGLEGHVSSMEHHFSGFQIIYLLEGMNVWFRTNRNARNRAFTSAARTEESSSSQANRRRWPVREYIDEEPIEDALLALQVEHDVLIHHTNVPVETAQWITIFTQHISTVPYRRQKDRATLSAGFCMESGQVRTGEDKQDTFVRMLEEIARVTAPIAYGVAKEFDTVTKLVNGLEAGGQMRLEGVNKCANKDGVMSDRTIGQAMSKRLWKVFTGRDDTSTDV